MTAVRVVSNSSPLIALERIGQLELLRGVFEKVTVPPAVVSEVWPATQPPDWFDVVQLTAPASALVLSSTLGAGEREAIALAVEIQPNFILLDDRAARRAAEALGIPVLGLLGVLLAAKRRGLLSAIRPFIESLTAAGFRVAPELAERVLRDAGE